MARELQSSSALAELSYLSRQTPSSKPAYPHSPNTPPANLRDFQGSLPQLSTLPQERRASARRGCSANATATPIPHTFGSTRHVRKQERRASARRGYRYRTCKGASAKSRETVAGVSANVNTIAVAGGASVMLRAIARWHCECACANPLGANAPRSCCIANVCRRKNDFFDARTHIQPGAAGVSPPWLGGTIGVP